MLRMARIRTECDSVDWRSVLQCTGSEVYADRDGLLFISPKKAYSTVLLEDYMSQGTQASLVARRTSQPERRRS